MDFLDNLAVIGGFMAGETAASAAPGELIARASHGLTTHQLLYAAAKLGIADLLQPGPLASDALARRLDVNEPALYRVLRYLSSQGVFEETEGRTFANTPLSETLCTGFPGSVRAALIFRGSAYYYDSFKEILYTIQTGQPARERICGMNGFEFLKQNPEEARLFDDAMTNMSELTAPAVAGAYDFGAWGSIMDVGGGNGMLLRAILNAHPQMRGVLADLPHVLERARERGFLSGKLAPRSGFAECDFFREVPPGCRAYLMKNVIHDWDDARAQQILANCRRAIPTDGVLLLVEWALPEGNVPSFSKQVDVAMMLLTGGKERTVAEYRELLAGSGFRLNQVITTPAELMILEACPA
jgi:O-methyltransferase/methyltransferase family protein